MEETVAFKDSRWYRSVCLCVSRRLTLQRLDPCLSCSSGLNCIHNLDDHFLRYWNRLFVFATNYAEIRSAAYTFYITLCFWFHNQYKKKWNWFTGSCFYEVRFFIVSVKELLNNDRHYLLPTNCAVSFNFLDLILKILPSYYSTDEDRPVICICICSVSVCIKISSL